MAENVFQTELRPSLRVELRRPGRKRCRADALEDATAVEGEIRHEADLPFQSERQNRFLDAAVGHGVVRGDEVDPLVAHDRLEWPERGHGRARGKREVMHADVPDL